MKKRALRIIQIISWTLGFIALGLIVYGIIRTLS
jgi:hypothetical protein